MNEMLPAEVRQRSGRSGPNWPLLRRESGAVAVEFALVMPVLIVALLTMVDLGRASYIRNVLDRTASIAAQMYAIGDTATAVTTAVNSVASTNLPGMSGTGQNPSLISVTTTYPGFSVCPPDTGAGTNTGKETTTVTVKMGIGFKWVSPLSVVSSFGSSGRSDSITASATWLCVYTK